MTTQTESPPVSPRVGAVRARIANLPPVFVSPALEDALIRRATAQDAREQVEDRLRRCANEQDDVLAVVRQGRLEPDAIDRLMRLGTEAAALSAVAAELPAAVLPDHVVRATVDTVSKALRSVALAEPLPSLRYEADMAAWRTEQQSSRTPVDPPQSLASDLAAAAELRTVRERHERWRAGIETWERDARTGTADLLAMLEAAADYVREGEAVAAAYDAVRPVCSEANALRREAGLTWTPPTTAGVR